MQEPRIIQGGMGVGVSGWPLAKAVSMQGQLGVVSGTGIAVILTRRLQQGDLGGHIRRAMDSFPLPGMSKRILDRYFIEGGKAPEQPFQLIAMPHLASNTALDELTVLANFVEVFLAKEGHGGLVGVNYLEKIQIPTLASLFGAMLAGVDYVLMGAGIPRFIPGVLDAFSEGRQAELGVHVEEATAGTAMQCRFNPAEFCGGVAPQLHRPKFLAIISSATLAMTLARKSNGRVDGFVVEGPTAGGHNAPPRGPLQLSVSGEPLYGVRDAVDFEKLRELGVPFWLAGGFAEPGKLNEAIGEGASGIQVGSAFAFCDESSIGQELKSKVIGMSRAAEIEVFTDPIASPTGFPFKVLKIQDSLSEAGVYGQRTRLCDVGYLRHPYQRADGTVGYRCPAEPVEHYLRKGGQEADTVGRKCLCNALFATIDLGQVDASGQTESMIVTAGDDAAQIARFLKPGQTSYTAGDVIRYLLN